MTRAVDPPLSLADQALNASLKVVASRLSTARGDQAALRRRVLAGASPEIEAKLHRVTRQVRALEHEHALLTTPASTPFIHDPTAIEPPPPMHRLIPRAPRPGKSHAWRHYPPPER